LRFPKIFRIPKNELPEVIMELIKFSILISADAGPDETLPALVLLFADASPEAAARFTLLVILPVDLAFTFSPEVLFVEAVFVEFGPVPEVVAEPPSVPPLPEAVEVGLRFTLLLHVVVLPSWSPHMFCMKKLRLPFDHDQAEASKLIRFATTDAAPVAALPTWVLLLAATLPLAAPL